MPFYPVVARKTALIVFDLMNEYVGVGGKLDTPEAREVLVPRLAPFIVRCREAGVLIVFVATVLEADGSNAGILESIYPGIAHFRRGSWGVEIYSGLGRQPTDLLIEKTRFSAFHGTHLEQELRERGIDTVIVTGCSTAVGCETLARDATSRDFKVVLTSDGTVTRPLADIGWGAFSQSEVHRFTLTLLGHTFARIATIDEVLSELAKR